MPDLLTEGREPLLLGPEVEAGEGDFEEVPFEEESPWSGQRMGGRPGEPGGIGFKWEKGKEEDVPPEESLWSRLRGKGEAYKSKYEEDFINRVNARARKWGFPEATTYEEAQDLAKEIDHFEEYSEVRRRSKLEEEKAYLRGYKSKYRKGVGEKVGVWTRKYLKPRPQPELAKIFFPGRALRETYIPRAPVKTTEGQIQRLREEVAPKMGLESPLGRSVTVDTERLKRASAPPPMQAIKAPGTRPAEYEGLGSALTRLRRLGELKKVDQAVLAEVHANGDIDTPSHVAAEVSRLGFGRAEIDNSLRRLRDLGFIVPTGRVYQGEKELMLSGGSHG